MTFQPTRGISKAKRSCGDRWLEGRGADRLEVESQSARVANEVVLTLLWLS
jgi:hypothetical protein